MNGRPKIKIRGGLPVLPHNVETERAVLGAVMLDSRLFHEMSNDARLTADDFMRPPHQNLWELYGQMAAEGAPIDLVGVLTRIGHDPEFFGGVAHVAALLRHRERQHEPSLVSAHQPRLAHPRVVVPVPKRWHRRRRDRQEISQAERGARQLSGDGA